MKHTVLAISALFLAAAVAHADDERGRVFVAEFDTNKDGKVTKQEAEDRRAEIFDILDRDRDGKLDRDELVRRIRMTERALGDKGIDYRAGSDDVDGFIAFYDKNDDGLISKDEYKRGQRAWFRKKDKNRDGVLSLADLR